jgi:hypothetical protein
MSQGGFEPTIPVFEREKAVHALDHTATMIGPGFKSLARRPATVTNFLGKWLDE